MEGLERQAQRELPATGTVLARNGTVSGISGVRIRVTQVREVGRVISLGAELRVQPFLELEVLDRRKVPARLPRAANAAEVEGELAGWRRSILGTLARFGSCQAL